MHESPQDLMVARKMLAGSSPFAQIAFVSGAGRRCELGGLYQGASAFLVCGGPSLEALELTELARRGIFSLAMNNAWSVVRPTAQLSVDNPQKFLSAGWLDPGVLKFTPARHADVLIREPAPVGHPIVTRRRVRDCPATFLFIRNDHFDHTTWTKRRGMQSLNWGQHPKRPDSLGIASVRSCMLAGLHLLYALGFRRVFIIGADFHMGAARPYAWGQSKGAGGISHNLRSYQILDQRFAALDPLWRANGFDVWNATPGSAMRSLRRIAYPTALELASASSAGPIDAAGWYDTTDIPQEPNR